MTIDDAIKLAESAREINDRLRDAFPCRDCDGTGDCACPASGTRADGPCPECWGRGWVIDLRISGKQG